MNCSLGRYRCSSKCSVMIVAMSSTAILLRLLSPASALHQGSFVSNRINSIDKWGVINRQRISPCMSRVLSLRSGATVEEEDEEAYGDEEEDEYDEESSGEEEEEDKDENEEEKDDDDDEEEDDEVDVGEAVVVEYDRQLSPPAGLQMGGLLGVMLLSQKIDMFNPKVVRLARFVFIFYVIAYQAFLIYVRIMAKLENDRTEIVTTNPLSGLMNAQLGQQQEMVKDLASQFLSSKTTVMEYDLRQVKSMMGSLLFNMAFMWFLHFKMEQTQPLVAQAVTGTINLVYHPLFQVYILGRNLERPFKGPAPKELSGGDGDESEATNENEDETQKGDEEEEKDDEDIDDDDDDDEEVDDASSEEAEDEISTVDDDDDKEYEDDDGDDDDEED